MSLFLVSSYEISVGAIWAVMLKSETQRDAINRALEISGSNQHSLVGGIAWEYEEDCTLFEPELMGRKLSQSELAMRGFPELAELIEDVKRVAEGVADAGSD